MGLAVAPGLAGLWGARAIGVAPQAPGHDPLLPQRDGGPWLPKGNSLVWAGGQFFTPLCAQGQSLFT